jgi:hypothetical protein
MSIAFSAVFLFLLFSPGIAFRMAFLKSDSFQVTMDTSLVSEVLLMLFPAAIFHCLGIVVVEGVWGKNVPFDQIYYLIIGNADLHVLNFAVIKAHFAFFLSYLTIQVAVGYGLGRGFQWLVLHFNLDRLSRLLRPFNHWDYLLTGRILGPKNKIGFILIDVIVAGPEGDLIYCGILEKYFLSKDKNLDKLYLVSVFRRKFKEDTKQFKYSPETKEEAPMPSLEATADFDKHEKQKFNHYFKQFDKRYYQMPGDYFIIAYSQVKNMNITYYTLNEVAETAAAKQ